MQNNIFEKVKEKTGGDIPRQCHLGATAKA